MEKNHFYVRILADTNLYIASLGDNPFKYGEYIVIRSEFGEDIGFISSFPFKEMPDRSDVYKSGKMLRYATDEDKELAATRLKESRNVRIKVGGMAKDLNLEMNITHILLPLTNTTLVVYYTAEGKVDFRELLKRMKAEFKQKIIMRQIRSKDRMSSFYLDSRNPVNHY